ncbi:sensor histidine kinase [Ekhidna sp.]
MQRESTFIVISLYVVQALLALIIILILRRFYKEYQNKYFEYWSWSWLAMIVNMLGSGLALRNVFVYPAEHPFRLAVSIITIAAGITQVVWLYAGSYELSLRKRLNQRIIIILSILSVPIAFILVFSYLKIPEAVNQRIFFRVGIKALFSAIAFIASSILIVRLWKIGIGVKFIAIAFLLYGLEQLNYFISSVEFFTNINSPVNFPYYLGIYDLFFHSMMGMGMIISMLEFERYGLKKANKELDTFLYHSSHDLRAPLTTISGIISAIKTTKDESTIKEFLDAAEARIAQADNVIRDIITLRRGQKTDVEIREIDLKKEIQQQFDLLLAPNSKAPILSISEIGSSKIHNDPIRLHTVLINIISNAIKYHDYSKKHPSIDISLCQIEGGVKLKIEDNGPGIDKKHLSKIFDMFYRANQSSTGTGLGLYLVKDALDKMKGSIKVTSEKGIGTTFDIFIRDLA